MREHGRLSRGITAAILLGFIATAGVSCRKATQQGQSTTRSGSRWSEHDAAEAEWAILCPPAEASAATDAAPAAWLARKQWGDAVDGEVIDRWLQLMDAGSYRLLLKEARQSGITLDQDTLRTAALFARLPEFGSSTAQEAIRNWLLITCHLTPHAPPRTPEAYRELLGKLERAIPRVSLRVVRFDAAEFTAVIPKPNRQQLTAFFEKYRQRHADEDEMGFGYRGPQRLRIEYLMIPRAAIRDRVSENRDVYRVYRQDPDRYQRVLEAPVTRPSTRPTPPPISFMQIPAAMKSRMRETLADAGTSAMAGEVLRQMTSDWTAVRQADPGAVPPTRTGTPYKSPQYLKRLAKQMAQIESHSPDASWHGARPLVGPEEIERYFAIERAMESRWYGKPFLPQLHGLDGALPTEDLAPPKRVSIDRLSDLPGIGRIDLFCQLRAFYGPFLNQSQLSELRMLAARDEQLRRFGVDRHYGISTPVELWQPSQPITDLDGNVYVYRIVDADMGEVPSAMAGIEARVAADWMACEAYARTREAAQDVLNRAKGSDLARAVPDRSYLDTGVLPDALTAATTASTRPSIPQEIMVRLFREGLRVRRTGLKEHNERPMGIIESPRDRFVLAVQILESTPK